MTHLVKSHLWYYFGKYTPSSCVNWFDHVRWPDWSWVGVNRNNNNSHKMHWIEETCRNIIPLPGNSFLLGLWAVLVGIYFPSQFLSKVFVGKIFEGLSCFCFYLYTTKLTYFLFKLRKYIFCWHHLCMSTQHMVFNKTAQAQAPFQI